MEAPALRAPTHPIALVSIHSRDCSETDRRRGLRQATLKGLLPGATEFRE